MHIEREYRVDLDEGLTPLERATAFAIELAIDRELAPAVTYFRWMVPANFEKGPAVFFNQVPPEQREAFKKEVVPSVWQQYADVIGQDLIDELLANQK